MKKILFLDDDNERHAEFKLRTPGAIHVHTAEQCQGELAKREWDEVHLDHDLNGQYQDASHPNTGSGVVRWIAAQSSPLKVNWFIVHSYNQPAAIDMVRKLDELGYRAIYHPFGFSSLASFMRRAHAE